jgi:hypothetical protein
MLKIQGTDLNRTLSYLMMSIFQKYTPKFDLILVWSMSARRSYSQNFKRN